MFLKPPRKWPPRVFAVYLVTTIAGGVILILFLILLGLMYWMNAKVPLPDPKRMVHPNATAWLIVKAESLNALPVETLAYLTDGAPPQISHLLARAGGEKPCPIQLVLSTFPDADGKGRQMSMAVSLGRYPGQFWLVRRDLERRVEKQSLPMSLQYHAHKAIFSAGDWATSLSALSLVGCTVLRCPNPATTETLIDQMEKPLDARQTPVPQGAYFEGWAGTWQDIPLSLFFPGEQGGTGWQSLKIWKGFLPRLQKELPAITEIHDISFSGIFTDRQSAAFNVTFSTDKAGASVLAERIYVLLNFEKIGGSAKAVGPRGVVEVVSKIRFTED